MDLDTLTLGGMAVGSSLGPILGAAAVLFWIRSQLRILRERKRSQELLQALRKGDFDRLTGEAGCDPVWEAIVEVLVAREARCAVDEERAEESARLARVWRRRFEELPMALVLVDERQRVVELNRAAAERLGTSSTALRGCSVVDFFEADTVDFAPGEGREWPRAFGGGDADSEADGTCLGRVLDSKGEAIPATWFSAGEPGSETNGPSQPLSVLFLGDVRASARDRQGLDALGRLAGSIAHDFNDTLTAILGHGALLAPHAERNSKMRLHVDGISSAAEEARVLTQELLAFSRSKIARRDSAAEGGASARAREESSDRGEALPVESLSSADDRTPTLCLLEDDERIRSVFKSLLEQEGYAVIPAGSGAEALERAKSLSRLDLLLADVHMPGMHGPEVFERLRQKFNDLPVIFMSGYVDHDVVDQELIGQTEFLQKPFAPSELAERVRRVLANHVEADARRLRVLVVDDDRATQRMLQALLNHLGYECFLADSGEGALRILERLEVDLVLSDMVMPVMDGLRLCSLVRGRYPSVRFIAMSGCPRGDSNLRTATALGASAVLRKPFSKDELHLALRGAG